MLGVDFVIYGFHSLCYWCIAYLWNAIAFGIEIPNSAIQILCIVISKMPATKKNLSSKYRGKSPPYELAFDVSVKTPYKKLLANFQEMLKYEYDDPEIEHMLQDLIYEKLISDIATKKFRTHEELLDMASKVYLLVLKPSQTRGRWFA